MTTERNCIAERKCLGCGEPFTPLTRQGKYCNKRCGQRLRYKIITAKKKICQECGTEFPTKNHSQKYCSDKCGNYSRYRKLPKCGWCGQRVPKPVTGENGKTYHKDCLSDKNEYLETGRISHRRRLRYAE